VHSVLVPKVERHNERGAARLSPQPRGEAAVQQGTKVGSNLKFSYG
jgi:hypothetical protein